MDATPLSARVSAVVSPAIPPPTIAIRGRGCGPRSCCRDTRGRQGAGDANRSSPFDHGAASVPPFAQLAYGDAQRGRLGMFGGELFDEAEKWRACHLILLAERVHHVPRLWKRYSAGPRFVT